MFDIIKKSIKWCAKAHSKGVSKMNTVRSQNTRTITISPLGSQVLGLIVSAVVGLAVFVAVWQLLVHTLNFWHIGDVLGPSLGAILGGLSTFEMFTRRRREIPLYWIGVSLFLGKPTGGIYENGFHWVFPFFGIYNCPGPKKVLSLEMPGEKINAQDGITVFFGVSEPEHPGKHNRLQWSVVDPLRYIAVDNPEDLLREEFIEKARLFFGQLARAIGVKNVKLLFDEWIDYLPIDSRKQETHPFATRLREARFATTGTNEDPRLFSPDSVLTIMKFAGAFKTTAATWGIGNIAVFTPNVRANPEAERAAAQKQTAKEEMDSLKTKADRIKTLAGEMTKDNKVNPDLAATLVAGLSGQPVAVENKTVNISGLPEMLKGLGELAISKLSKKS